MRSALILLAPGCAWIAPADHDRAMRAPPTIAISEPTLEGVYYADVPVALQAVVDDAEDPEGLVVQWTANGEPLDADAPGTDGGADLVLLATGEQRIEATVTDPDGKSSTATLTIAVLAGNTAPTCRIDSPADGETVAVGALLQVRATLGDAEAPLEWLTADWSSDVDGPLLTASADETGTSTGTLELSPGVHLLTLRGADELGLTCTDSVTVTVGDPPTVAITWPANGTVVAEGALVQFAALVDDPSADPSTGEAEWTSDRDGTFGFSSPAADGTVTFESSALSVGAHEVTLAFTSAGGLVGSDTFDLVVNGAPTLSRVDITPLVPVTGDELVATATASDPEADTLTYDWTWSKDGVVQADLVTDRVGAGRVRRGETWTASATASDALSTTSARDDSVEVGNAVPIATSAQVTPSPLTVLAPATASLAATDADGDTVSWSIAWTVNGVAAGTGSSLSASAFARGDTVALQATPSDGTASGASVSASAVVANAAPALSSVAISPASPEEAEDDLLCDVVGSDPDGDTLSWTISWTVDGAPYTGSVRTSEISGDTIAARYTAATLEWTCTATADDGTDSVTVTSDVASIRPAFDGFGAEFDVGASGGAQDPWTWVGYGGAAPADVDGDGVPELLVGSDRALVYAFTVATLSLGYSVNLSYAARTIETIGGDTDLGVGDIDGDGDPNDLVIFGSDGNTFVVTQSTLATDTYVLATSEADWRVTSASATVGADGSVADVDGDGIDDIIASSTSDHSVRVVSGGDLGGYYEDYDSAAAWLTLPTGDWWGLSVAATDWDGDGLADLAAGSDADAVCAWPGDSTWPGVVDMCADGLTLSSSASGELAGERIQAGGDVDGDGTDDLLVPAYAANAGAGRLYVVRGADMAATGWAGTLDLSSSWLVIDGERAGDAFGFASGQGAEPAATADVDGDSRADLVVSSSSGYDSYHGFGASYLFLAEDLAGGGGVSAADAATRFYSSDYFFMCGVGSAGDVNADGFDDLWFAMPSYYDAFTLVLSH